MKEERQRPGALGHAVTKPDILAEVDRGEAAVVTTGQLGEHRNPRPCPTPTAASHGSWLGKEVKSEEEVSPPPDSPPSRRAGDRPVPPPPERGCGYCGIAEPGAGNGGFISPLAAFESRRCRLLEPECAECGRGGGQKPDLVRHRLAHGGDGSSACSRCGRGFAEAMRLETAGNSSWLVPCAGRSAGTAEAGPAAPRKERKELSLTEKVRVLEMLEGPKVSQSELAKRFGVSQPQICRIIKNKERILTEWHRNGDPERKRKREGKDAALEAALLRWVEGSRAADLPVTAPLLQLKAKHLAEALGRPNPEPGGTWLARCHHNVAFKKPPAEKGDTEQPTAEHWAGAVLPGILGAYAPSEIYTCGETEIVIPAGDRVTLLVCANADGSEKAPLRAVGRSPRPRCLRGVNLAQMPWSYRASSLGGVTAPLFAEWLQEFNEGLRRHGKSVLLVLAKHEAHPYLQLSNVRMVFFPPATALAQPLDRGIVSDLKGHYRRRLLRRMPAEHGVGQPTLLDALHMLAQAWGDVCPGLIAGCFRAAGFVPDTEAPVLAALPGSLNRERLERHGNPTDEDADEDEDPVEGKEAAEPAAGQPCPSEREVWASLATLRRYLECRATSPDLFQAFYELEDAVQMLSANAGQALLGDKQ
ncbi:tigger transposable element-derived protein 3-like isoform X2 [Cuculus canorus]|uniref:tigger transposable element-derived protein 3-like isoform X2 n=1 Tax=Cuculus canorus TaxID=55661 RepID=UPI0023AB4749|nr:tigger transposable element-derived protein 3-like isoform X2 [Cuculus canorus]